jgi:arginine decarboxylase-like protein
MKNIPTEIEGVHILHGITGNYYVLSSNKEKLMEVCDFLDKSHRSITWSTRYNIWSIRVKAPKHKRLLKEYEQKINS